MGTQTIELQETEQEEQDELSSALEGSKEDSQKAEESSEEEETKAEETKEETEEGAEEKEEEKEETEQELSEVEKLRKELSDLRQMLRSSKRESSQMQARMARLGMRSAPSEEDEEEEESGQKKEQPLSKMEQLQGAIADIGNTRGAQLDILLETMAEGSYPDVKEVCSRANFDDIFETIASEVVNEKGGNLDETLLEVEYSVWNRANPYKYMYDLIKKYHPTYANAEKEAEKEEKTTPKKKEPAKAPGSIGNLGGDSNVKGGWTAKKIDAMSEEELDNVPQDVYDRYMRGELD